MKRLMVSSLAALLITLALPTLTDWAQDEPKQKPPAEQKPDKSLLEQAGRAVGGVWVDEAGVKDPKAPHGKFMSEWGVNEKMLRSKTWWSQGGKDMLMYEGIQFWHPHSEKLTYYEIGATGSVYEGTSELKDGVWISRFTAYEAGKVTEYEQHGEYLDDDTMTSTVYVRQDGELKVLKTFKFHRMPEGWPNVKDEEGEGGEDSEDPTDETGDDE